MSQQNNISSEERNKVYELCKTQFGGEWAKLSESQLIIKPVPNGFVNKLYFCFLPENIETQYKGVVVRFNNKEIGDYANITHMISIALIMSSKCISPKVLRIFKEGSIVEYIECRYFNANDDLNTKTVEMLAQKVATIHSIVVPLPKDTVDKHNDGIFEMWFSEVLRNSYRKGVIRELIEKHKYKVLSKLDYIEEMVWMRKTMEHLKSPIVLSHNDLNRRNILIREQNETNNVELFLIDFDWTNYYYRGTDLGQYFAEWRQKVVDFSYIKFPSDEEMSVFIDAYIKEMCKICGTSYAKQEINSRERLIKESKVFALYSYLKDILYLFDTTTQNNYKDTLSKAEDRFRSYDELKNRILKEYKTL